MNRYVQIIFCVLLFFSVSFASGWMIFEAAIDSEPSLEENTDIFRSFDIASERLDSTDYQELSASYLSEHGTLRASPKTNRLFLLFHSFRKEKRTSEYASAFETVLKNLEYFPVGKDGSGEEKVTYENSWGGARNYGGSRRHEGTDLMATKQVRGYFPILSVSDGVVEKKGWLNLGGYRIGIRSPSGAYFYYAHLERYADGMEEGKKIKAGQLLGYMGDSGYGKEGTVGQFDVHLHFGIYLKLAGREQSINPYQILRYLDLYKKHKSFYHTAKL